MVTTETKHGTGTRHKLSISGSGTAAGGTYGDVKIAGDGRIEGDLDCHQFKCLGKSEVHGNLQARSVSVQGQASLEGSVQAESVVVQGACEFGQDLSFETFRCDGMADVRGSLSGDEVLVRGQLKTRGDCEAEVFTANGAFEIGGLLNAGRIEVKLYGGGRVKEIGGEQITVQRAGLMTYLKKLFVPQFQTELVADTIEGDVILLENTRAQVVRGNRVTIGAGCDIKLVEYKSHFAQEEDAQVGASKQV
ncbi:MAG TPA: polymer-forming cytoskeletal protein [Bacilli bacterium]|nr:polymer-forming cytoskeletal protein [Bacilli bacterium]